MGGALMAAIIDNLYPLPDTERAATERPMELSALLNPPPRPTERLLLLEAVLGTDAIVPGKRKREGAGAAPERHGPPPRSGGDADDADGLDAPLLLLGSLVAVEEADKWRKLLILAAPSSLMMDALAELLCKQALGDDAEIDEGAAATRGTAALIGQPIGLPSCSAAPPAPPARSGLLEYLLPEAFSKAVVSEAIVERLGTADAWEEASAREMAVARGVGEPEPEPYPYPYPSP